jgi:predicted O-methyltransferase YrrM
MIGEHTMDLAVETVLKEYELRADKENRLINAMPLEEFRERRDEFLLSVGPETGRLCNMLVKQSGAKMILEVGTSYGYSTVWLAEAARATGGRVITLEIREDKQEHAKRALDRAGLSSFVDFRLGDAPSLIGTLNTNVDFVLLDLWKDLYIPCFDGFYTRLNPGALVVADNMVYPEQARPHAIAYREHIRGKDGIESVLLPVGSGLEVSRFAPSHSLLPWRSQET